MPQTPVQSLLRRAAPRWLRSTGAALAALLLVTCSTDTPLGPGHQGIGSLRVVPTFNAFARVAPLTLDNVRIIVVRPPADTLVNTDSAFRATSSQLQLNIPVFLQALTEDLQVTLELYSGTVLLFRGTTTVQVSQGVRTPPASIPVTYQGPGSQVTTLTIAPRDTTLSFGAKVPFTVDATDANATPVSQYYVSWSVIGAATGTTVDGAGTLTAPAVRDTFYLKVVTPTGVADSTQVFVTAPASALVKSGGDQQTALAGSRLPQDLAVQVNGSDGLPVPGAVVSFVATTGGGSVDSATATADASGIARSGAILGATVGAQTFTASATGLTAVVFAETATGIAPAPVTLDGGGNHSCEIRGATTMCWGENLDGELGDATNTDRPVAVPVVTAQTFTSLGLGAVHSCALTAAGAAFCWGGNFVGALGDGSGASRNTPVAVLGGHTFGQLAIGDDFSCGLTATGQAFCWGSNTAGELGDGTPTDRSAPVAVTGGHTFVTLAAGGSHTCGIDTGGAAWCWGLNTDGELGDGNLGGFQTAPVAVTGGLTFTTLAVGFNSSCALDGTGAGFCWGFNFGVQLTSPQPVAGGFTYSAIAMGDNHVCGLTTGGWRCGGDNSAGQLGDGSIIDRPSPVLPLGGHTFTTLGLGSLHSCGHTSTGTFCWGDNSLGQLGDGTVSQRLTPTLSIGPASTVAMSAGNLQSATVGTAVSIPPAVLVTDLGGHPLPGLDVTFAVASGGGSLTGAVTLTDASGVAAVGSWTLGATAGTNTLTATVSGAGISGNPATFSATGTSVGSLVTWTGAVSTDWSVAGNWSPAGVPNNTRDVVVPSSPSRMPALTTSCSALTLTVSTGATLNLNAVNCQVGGNVIADGAITGTGAIQIATTAQLRGNIPNLIASGPVTVGGRTVLSGNATISNGSLSLAGHTVTVAGSLTTQGTGVIGMTNPLDSLLVAGAGAFGGGDETALLTAGYLRLGGSFGQTSASSPASFAASGTHRTEMGAGAVRVINFASPGAGAGTSHFNDLIVNGASGGLSLSNNTFVNGQLISHPTGTTPVIGVATTAKVLTAAGVDIAALGINQNVMTIGAGVITQFDNVAFTGQATGVTQLTINNPGAVVALDFTGLSFGVTPVGGLYLLANDNNGATSGILTINMVTAAPAAPAVNLFLATGGAVINWPPTAGITWTGATSALWSVATNWSTGTVPTSTDNVLIPAGPSNMPSLSSSISLNNLTVQSGATLVTNDISLTVNGVFTFAGTFVGCCGDIITLNGGGSLGGSIDQASITVAAGTVVALSGNTTTTNTSVAVSGELILAGHTLDMGTGSFITSNGTGLLTMTNAQDQLIAGGADFSGGDETGHLTAGTFRVGSLSEGTVGSSSILAYFASGSHVTMIEGSGGNIRFAHPTASRLQELDLTSLIGTLSLQSNVVAAGQLRSLPGSANGPTVQGTGVTLIAGGANVGAANGFTALTMDGAALMLSSGTITSFNNVSFINQSQVGTALTVNNAGQASPYTFSNLVFTTALTAGGLHLQANDLDAVSPFLTIDMVGATPASGAGVSQATNGAVINWPPVGATITWTGTAGTDWFTAANWASGKVPSTGDNAVIPSGAPAYPIIFGNVNVNNMDIGSGASVTNTDFIIDVSGDLTGAGSFTGVTPTMTGTGATLSLASLSGLTITGSVRLGGLVSTSGSVIISGTGASLDLNGNGLVAGSLQTSSNGVLVSNSPNGVATVTGDVIFDGGDETGLLTDGGLAVGGSFTQASSTSKTSFAASGNFLTILNGSGLPQQINFASPGGTGLSHFALFELFGTVSSPLVSDAVVTGDAIINGGDLNLNTHLLQVDGNFATTGTGTITMHNSTDQLTVVGDAAFTGGSTLGLLTAGTLSVSGNFAQVPTPAGITTNYAPSGTHRTQLVGGLPQQLTMGSTGSGSAGSHFQILEIAGGNNPISLSSNTGDIIVDSVLIANTGGAVITGFGLTVTTRQVQAINLTLDNTPMMIDERGTALPQQFDGVTFQNMSTTSQTQLTVKAVGGAPRTLTFNNTAFTPLSGVGTAALYVSLQPSSGTLTLIMQTSPQGGPGGNGPIFTQVLGNGAVTWP